MRALALCLSAFAVLAACERDNSQGAAPTEQVAEAPRFEATLSDELPGLAAPASGIAFWAHPTLSFNSVMIVATANGVVSYNMEDGNEVARLDGFNANGAAVGYLGLGARAAGFMSFLDADESAFRFFGIDNQSRAFLPLEGGPAIRGAVRGFCLGRAQTVSTPTLFVIQKSKIQVFNLEADANGVSVASEATLDTPDNLVSCAVDIDGTLLVADDTGTIYRLATNAAFAAPLIKSGATAPGTLVVLTSTSGDEEAPTVTGQIILLDKADGTLHVFNREDGATLGQIAYGATDEIEGVTGADLAGISGANLGAVYRDGIIAFGVDAGEAGNVVRLAPANSLFNALGLPIGTPISPRGVAPVVEDDGLIIKPNFQTD